jgi:hypothetical protein
MSLQARQLMVLQLLVRQQLRALQKVLVLYYGKVHQLLAS